MVAGSLYPLSTLVVGRHGQQQTEKFWVQGDVPVKRVELECGFRLTGSHRHPFLVMGDDGLPCWRRADDLRVGDFVAIKSGMNCWGPDIRLRNPVRRGRWNRMAIPAHLTDDLAYLIGLWTAEGSYESTGRINISTVEPELRDWLCSGPFGLLFKANTTKGSEQTLRCSSHAFLDLLVGLGAVLGTASKKVVPEKIMSAPASVVRAFLQGLFDGDGCAYHGSVMLGTTSEQLARDVQILLLNFGVVAHLRKRPPAKPTKRAPNGGNYPLWCVTMTGNEVALFASLVGFRLARKQNLISNFVGQKSLVRGIPKQGVLIAQARQQKPRRARSTYLNKPPGNIAAIASGERPLRESLQTTVDWFEQYGSSGSGVDGLRKNLQEPDLCWLKVKSITDDQAFTVDFVLGGDHSFIANGVVSHNTPFHGEDLYGDLSKNSQYEHQKFPAIREDGTALWPERYDLKRLAAKREEIGSIRFTREFLAEPIADDMSLFPGSLFRGEPTEQPTLTLGMPYKFWKDMGVQIFMGVDFAMSSTVQADYTVIFTMGLDSQGNRWIIDIQRERGMAYQDQLSLINKIGKQYQAGLIFLESNQMQRIFGDELIRTTDLPVKKFVTGVQKNSLDKGVPSLRVLLENKKFRIPRGDRHSVEMTDIWINEMRSFTWADGKLQGVGAHDDLVMACWICDQAVKQGAFGFSFGDDDERGSLEETLKEQTAKDPDEEDDEDGKVSDETKSKASGNLVDGALDRKLPPGLDFGGGGW
jgi:hypothetical protein